MTERILVVGGRQLRRTMKAAGLDMKDLNRAHKAAAQVVADEATPPVRTGKLATTVRAGGTRTMGVVRAGYKSVPYAGPIHWGWPARNITANPFLSDAAQRSEPTWIELYEQEIDRIINKIEGA